MTRTVPLRSLRALTPDITAAIAARVAPKPAPEPFEIPEGKAGDCLRAMIARHGEAAVAAWFRRADWGDDAVTLPNEYAANQARLRFGPILAGHGFTVLDQPPAKGAA